MKLEFIDNLFEANEGPRIAHPEDTIFDGSATAAKYVAALNEVVANPGAISIKWDGGIALVFGRNAQGQFFCADKYMPNKGVLPTSPEQWVEYDSNRGANRLDLYAKIKAIWTGLEASVVDVGTYKGDLMAVGKEIKNDGKMIAFSPTTVEYRVPVDSNVGKLIAGKIAIIAVHQMNGAPWDGKSGLVNAGKVAILTPTAGIKFKLNDPVQLSGGASTAVKQYGKIVDAFLGGMDGVAQAAIKKYFNQKITGQTGEEIEIWLQKTVRVKQFKLLVGDNKGGYLYRNSKGYNGLKKIWNAIYQFKVNLAAQLEPQVKGFEQWTGGQQAGEGFVVNTSMGLIKLVNRGVFGQAHFIK